MMEPMPTTESLDEAVKAVWPHHAWKTAPSCAGFEWLESCFIAHARTLDKLHNREPVNPIEAAIMGMWSEPSDTFADEADFKAACRKHFSGLTFPEAG